ncbi:hypothetical protein FZ928_05560 [Klebsiella pneumoniae]|uniref:Ferredoxin--NAD(+) reductase n=1 Tax=Klebsiella pneumoniae TaxID=573 RepID=A0A5C2LM49_KLEPN|nr:hypothetical protein FZ928_05560 [Klebsiella pneumoniae]
MFATGSRPFIPPLPGIDRPQVMPFRTSADVERILAIPGPAVVIGGGVLGVEAAAALRRHGGEVTLLHRGSGLMAPLTDAFAADELRQQLEARGIRCVLACRIAAIDADGVRLADGRVFRAARVVLATGVQPDSRLAAQSGVLCQRGSWSTVRWPPRCRGSAPSANVAKLTARPGLVAPSPASGRGAGGSPVRRPGEGFVWQDAGTRLKVTGIELFSAGEQQAGEQDDIYTSWDPIDRHYRRLLLRDGRLRGVLLMGDCTAAAALTARPKAMSLPATWTGFLTLFNAAAGCRNNDDDETCISAGGTWHGRPPFSRTMREPQSASAISNRGVWRRALPRLRPGTPLRVFCRTQRRVAVAGGRGFLY